jgi:hypothetical protein
MQNGCIHVIGLSRVTNERVDVSFALNLNTILKDGSTLPPGQVSRTPPTFIVEVGHFKIFRHFPFTFPQRLSEYLQ